MAKKEEVQTNTYFKIENKTFKSYLSSFQKKIIEALIKQEFDTDYILTKILFKDILKLIYKNESGKKLILTSDLNFEIYQESFFIYKKSVNRL